MQIVATRAELSTLQKDLPQGKPFPLSTSALVFPAFWRHESAPASVWPAPGGNRRRWILSAKHQLPRLWLPHIGGTVRILVDGSATSPAVLARNFHPGRS